MTESSNEQAPLTSPAGSAPTSTATPLSALSGLVRWSEDLPLWQRDALRRLYQKTCALSDTDEAELLLLCKEPYGLLAPQEIAPTAQALSSSDVPTGTTRDKAVSISSLRNPERVNALSGDQTLTFEEKGLTVVFGNNATGKSGYARILKSACRARSAEGVLANVYDEATPTEPATAEIRYAVGGSSAPAHTWKHGERSPDPLSAISVFDAKCALFHVEKKNEAAYTPLALQILRALASTCGALKKKLENEEAALSRQVPVSLREPKWNSSTKAGTLLDTLSPETDIATAKELATLTQEESTRLQMVRVQLQADPVRLAGVEESKRTRLTALITRIETLEESLNDNSLESYRLLLDDLDTKSEAARVAATGLFKDEPLPNVGSETWRALWEAARAFSKADAYPDKEFPYTNKEAVCVLCQQPFDHMAKARMGRFAAFVKANAQQMAEGAARKTRMARQDLEAAEQPRAQLRQDVALLRDEFYRKDLAHALLRFHRLAAVRRAKALRPTSIKEWPPTIHPFGPSPKGDLNTLSQTTGARIRELLASSQFEERQKLEQEQNELADRELLKTILPDVEAEIARKKKLSALKSAIDDTGTNKVTRKSTELADALITAAWRDRFLLEVSRLAVHHLRIELRREVSRDGAAQFRLVLVRNPSTSLGSVLSEGEYRCIALAAFLSELALSDHDSGIVFDDPVSSLDHDYRDFVAKRLVDLAAGRQIIVFTHDVVFLDSLSRAAKDKGVKSAFRTVSRLPDNSRSGIIEDSIPSNVAPAEDLAD